MINVLIIIGAIISVLMFVFLIGLIIGYYEHKDFAVKMKYKHFKTMYYISPEKWNLDMSPSYGEKIDKRYICFNFAGFLRYLFFWGCEERRAKKRKQERKQAELIEKFQKDIEQYKSESKEYINNKLDKM